MSRCPVSSFLPAGLAALQPALALVLISAFFANPVAHAESSRFESAVMRGISLATDLVTEPHHKQYVLGDQLVFTRRDSKAAREIRASGLQARIFTLAAGQQEPVPWAEFDPCLVYLSVVAPIAPVNEPTINLGSIVDDQWLTAIKGKHIDIGRYLLVFEKSDDEKQWIRLDKGSKSAYFKSGLYFEIRPPSFKSYSQAEVDSLAAGNQGREQSLKKAAQVNDRSSRCYVFETIRVASGDEQLAYLDDCSASESLP